MGRVNDAPFDDSHSGIEWREPPPPEERSLYGDGSSITFTFNALLGVLRKRCPECKATRFLRQPLVEVDSEGKWQEIGEPELICAGCRTLWLDYRQLDDYRQEGPLDLSIAEAFDVRLQAEARAAREAGRPVLENVEN